MSPLKLDRNNKKEVASIMNVKAKKKNTAKAVFFFLEMKRTCGA